MISKAEQHNIVRKLHRLMNERWYISFSLANSYNPITGKWTKGVWPILFTSEEAAKLVLEKFPIFANSAAVSGRGKIKSACVERILI